MNKLETKFTGFCVVLAESYRHNARKYYTRAKTADAAIAEALEQLGWNKSTVCGCYPSVLP